VEGVMSYRETFLKLFHDIEQVVSQRAKQ
jgi:hypothetical protein